MLIPARRRGVAALTAAVLSVTGIGLAASPAQAVAAPPMTTEALVLVPARYTVAGAIRTEWHRLGGASGWLGAPTSQERRLHDGGASQSFQGGQIHWSPATGARPTTGAIQRAWAGTGWEAGFLGYPTSHERRLSGGGVSQSFQGGQIHWSPATGAHPTTGAIQKKWAATGWENGFLGYPTSHERRLSGGGVSQSFQGGQIHWSPATGAHPTTGAIQQAWAAAGWEKGRYGYPVGDEYPTPAGRAQRFEGGVLTWTDPARTVTRTYRGTGDGVFAISKPDGPGSTAVVTSSHTGGSTFIVWGLGADHGETDLLVNDLGSYSGTTLLDEADWGGATTQLSVQADGEWTVTVSSLSTLPEHGAGAPVTGTGDAVFRYTGTGSSRSLTHQGHSNFIVWSHPAQGGPELLANTIGSHSGRAAYPGPAVVEVAADGAWSVRP